MFTLCLPSVIVRPLCLATLSMLLVSCGDLFGIEEIEYQAPATDGGFADSSADALAEAKSDAPAAVVIQAPGCTAAMTCGNDGANCCESRLLPGGTYLQGCDWSPITPCVKPWGPEHPSTVGAFYLDTFEVTVARFRIFMEEYNLWRSNGNPKPAAGKHPRIADSGWRAEWDQYLPKDSAGITLQVFCTDSNDDFPTYNTSAQSDRYPINCIKWPVAFAFCVWNDGRLPTEAEWEFAAAGGTENRNYPWGNAEPTPELANYNHDGPFPAPSLTVTHVGTHPKGMGRWGHQDLAGSVAEWLLDQDSDTWYGTPAGNPCNDCANLGTPKDQMGQRGGNWSFSDSDLLSAARGGNAGLHIGGHYSGIRCARDPKGSD